MLSVLLIFFCNVFLNQATILKCDFETACNDFMIDSNWGLTDGLHPKGIDHDHTLNTSSGHYLFYNPPSSPQFYTAQIKTSDWVQPTTDRAVCFRMWYYTPLLNFPFNIQLVQGDDEQLTRIAGSIPGKDPSIDDWTLINITLPSEKIKILIRLNVTGQPLVFDDISVDYCDGPRPLPPKILFTCDFESSCSNDFISFPAYPYQWSILNASDAVKKERYAPSVDYTFGNESGHYALLLSSGITGKSNVGYLHLQKEFQITSQQSYCLNFYYYNPGQLVLGNLNVFTLVSGQSETVQIIWPGRSSNQYIYASNKWTWGVINLPIGHYSLLFRVDNTNFGPSSFGLDNIDITSCDYPSSELSPYDSLLSFSCNFDNLTMCNMSNEDRFSKPTFNFTVLTGDTIPDIKLGPTQDHTTNSSAGGFIYWNQQLPYTTTDFGVVFPSKTIEQNFGMCAKFAYYVKSMASNKNGTSLGLALAGCFGGSLWSLSLDDSQGWQTVLVPVKNFACAEKFYFTINQREPVAVSVAFDDIEIDQCSSLIPITTTTSTSTSTTQIITTSRSSTTSVTMTRLTSTPIITTNTISTISTSTPNNAHRVLFLNRYNLIIIFILLVII